MSERKTPASPANPWAALMRNWLDQTEARLPTIFVDGRPGSAHFLRGTRDLIAEMRTELAEHPGGAKLAHHAMLIELVTHLPTHDLAEQAREQHRTAGRGGGRAKREAATALWRAVQQVKIQHPDLSWKAATRKWLHQTDPAWITLTDDQKDKRVTADLRRITRAKKNSGQ